MLHRQSIIAGRWGQILLILAAIWICFMVMVALPMMCTNPARMERSNIEPVSNRLSQAFLQLGFLKKQNEELKTLFQDFNLRDFPRDQQLEMVKQIDESVNKALDNTNDLLESAKTGKTNTWRKDIDQKSNPSFEYENVRKKVVTNTREFWNFVRAEVKKVQSMDHSDNPEVAKTLQKLLNLGGEHERSLLNDLHTLQEVDGYERWRESEANALSDLVQRRLHALQNPQDCSKAKKIVCNLNKGCGYGCQLHHVVYCFVLAYATERTLILHSVGWRYHRGGWEQIFQPLSDTCTTADGETKDGWPGKWYSQVITLPVIDALSPRPPFLPLAIPADLAPRIKKLHGAPPAWWLGQFLKFLLRPQPSTADFLEQATKKMEFKGPIVGIHVRRTDKVGTEAAFHSLDEYMSHVDEYFNQLEMTQKVEKRRVYVASDDPKVIVEAINKYPTYEVLGDTNVAKTAAVSTRYSDNSLHGIILDIHLLSRCDFLVCTFSSQVCRAAYEIMQSLHVDASDRFVSLDDIHYFGGQNAHNVMAVLPHEPVSHNPQEMQMKVGDIIGIAGNHWNGYSKGMNKRTNQIGLFPSFKAVDQVDVADFPTYTDVPLVQP